MDLDRIIQKYAQNSTLAMETVSPIAQTQPITGIESVTETSAVEATVEPTVEVLPATDDAELFVEEVFQLSNYNFDKSLPMADQIVDQSDLVDTAPVEDQELLKDISAIPDRLAFKIGDVADIVGVKQYVLRYWETEFDALKPKKSRQNQRMYTRKDVENIMLIKKLLYKDKFSIEGARKALKNLKTQVKETKKWDQVADKYEAAIMQLKELKSDLIGFRQSIL